MSVGVFGAEVDDLSIKSLSAQLEHSGGQHGRRRCIVRGLFWGAGVPLIPAVFPDNRALAPSRRGDRGIGVKYRMSRLLATGYDSGEC